METIANPNNTQNVFGAFLIAEVFAENAKTMEQSTEDTMIYFLHS
jgi:hypothetical protein